MPRCPGGRVLYLDFDGVLHPDDVWRHPGSGLHVAGPPGHALFERAGLLIRCLEPYPALRIVLSTDWVWVFRSVREMAHRLSLVLRWRVVGATFHSGMNPTRFRSGDVCRRQPAAWLALDDDDCGWPAVSRGHLVRTDPVLDISAPAALAELQARLAAKDRPEAGWR
ncbi:HAD domain-containing protein [Paraburkholderia sp. BL10I2N1]|uniref:HAD domain-containing protein n=1 Tax=Paraburkholderia sp. BL10I2N1 TaxID=1938796 RepID=UPI00105B20D9|nr:HAD domain-containing protein [Paraburkholderia sp. BL10I2N1]TDN69502.1 hypothetical protein B0G77_2894 [Paraburkholderia sp. BL10I2N1]